MDNPGSKSSCTDIVYTEQEVNVPAGYTAVVGEMVEGNVTITNTPKSGTEEVPPTDAGNIISPIPPKEENGLLPSGVGKLPQTGEDSSTWK